VKDLLASAQREVIARFAWSNMLLGLDYDGTLAPIVRRPEDAHLRPRTRALLAALCERYPVAIISGRARADVASRVARLGVREVVGNHGLEPGADAERCERIVRRWLPALHRSLDDVAGVEIEDKSLSVAVHYRRSRERVYAADRVRAAIDALPGARRTIAGKLVVNILPDGAPHKGVALLRLRRELGADTALYVGDDVTDEDVFAIDDPGRLLCVRVGRTQQTRAPYYVASQRAVDDLLARLVELRGDGSRHHRREERT
jgi:trehalose 6-phosphate phosphatase